MNKVLTLEEIHAQLAPNHNITIVAEEIVRINIPRTVYIAQDLGYTEFGRCAYFIKDSHLEELVNESREALSSYGYHSPLDYNWLDSTDEWVIHVGDMIIIDGLTEQAACALHDLLLGEMEEVVYICNDCDEIHEDETDTCDSCHGDCRIVSKADMDME